MSNAAAESRLVRAVGVWGLAAGIVNVTIGSGIFRLPSGVAAELGPAAPLAHLLCALAMVLIVLVFAEAGSRVPRSGGLYAYIEVAFGPLVGFVMGALLWAGLTAAMGAVAAFLADAAVALSPSLDTWWFRYALIVAVLAVLTLLNIRGVRGATGVNTAITVAKLVPLALVIIVGLASLNPANLAVERMPSFGDVSTASASLIFAFLGVEGALVPSGEVREPTRTVPRAIFIAIAGVTVVYLAVQTVAQSALGPALATSAATPVADAAGVLMGPWARTLLLVGMTVSMFGYLSGVTLAIPRMLFAFARDGFLPSRLAAVHDRFHTPHVAIVVQSVIAAALAISGTWARLINVANGATLIVYAVCCGALLQLRRRGVTSGEPPFVVPGAALVPVLAFVAVMAILRDVPLSALKLVGYVSLAALAIFAVSRRGR